MSLATNLQSLITRVGTEFKAIRVVTGALASLTTTDKASLVAAINEVKASIPVGSAVINDAASSSGQVYSSTKTMAEIAAAVAALVASAPGTLDTLDELAAALGDDASFATSVSTSLGNRVRVDAAQSFSAPEKAQALTNIGGQAAASVGDTEVDLVAAFNTAIA